MDCTTQYAGSNCTLPQTGFDLFGILIAVGIMLVVVAMFVRSHAG